ncbi:amino acid adenylation domain-containing protein, partial [Lysinibacillus sp. NPDC058147]|uniref:non-ribosomal peptide synthetase family protein n=1 Tax=unclassified Lysinibacillus TaxID=2636778 RepID=UPI0036DC4D90
YLQWLEERDKEISGGYWENYLAGYDQQSSLPKSIVSKESNVPYNRVEEMIVLDRGMTDRLRQLAESNQVTLNIVIQSIWGILLQRYNNTDDVVFGAVVSGRPPEIKGIEEMVGLFINTIPVRIKGSGNKTFQELLHDVQQGAMDSKRYDDYPLSDIQSKSELGSNLLDHVMVFENYPIQSEVGEGLLGASELIINKVDVFEHTNYDFDMRVIPGEQLLIKLNYNPTIYDQETIDRVEEHLKQVINTVIDRPHIIIKEIDILTAQESEKILYEFNNSFVEVENGDTIHHLFEEQVKQTPNHVALVSKHGVMTYDELNRKANQLANTLRMKGVSNENTVALFTDRSIEVVVGILAILKAGGAYVPIDPDYPGERIKFMLEDSNPKVILSINKYHDQINSLLDSNKYTNTNPDLIILDDQQSYTGSELDTNQDIKSNQLAYLIYTSGTTGQPKGVMVEHHGLCNLKKVFLYDLQIDKDDRILQFSSLSFDASAYEILMAFFCGASLYIPEKSDILDNHKFEQFMNSNKITVATLPPTYVNHLNPEKFLHLRKLLTAGSSTTHDTILRWKDKVEYYNAYGPTEDSICSSIWKCPKDFTNESIVSIGFPIRNHKIYILDNHHHSVPVGVVGELCVSGVGLTRGYLNRRDLTKEKYVDHPYEKGERIYKTGDLARWLPEGSIEYLGRIDDQVKIRGYRIELGEIETTLLRLKQLDEVVVMARKDSQNNSIICAYYVTNDETLDSQGLRAYLNQFLPDYMVPSYFIKMDRLPLSLNGKVDRKKLSSPIEVMNARTEIVEPRTKIEFDLVQVWKTALDIEQIGINDDFFELGGTSIKAMQVMSILSIDYDLRINDLFEHRTIANLAKFIEVTSDSLKDKVNQAIMNEKTFIRLNQEPLNREIKEKLDHYEREVEDYKALDYRVERNYKNVLLTGSTGYLGVYLLQQLMETTDYHVSIIVRGKNSEHGISRITNKLLFYFGEDFYPKHKHRISIFIGDITKPYLGLNEELYEKLSNDIDCIINSAANVKHYGEYSDFYDTNVLGTHRLIQFAFNNKMKDFNHISTISVASGIVKGHNHVLFTEFDYDVQQTIDSHYVMTKREAEQLVVQARQKGLKANIFRIGNIVFNSSTGQFQENIEDSRFYNILNSTIKSGILPNSKSYITDFSYVNEVSQSIILLFDREVLLNENYHIYNWETLNVEDIHYLLKESGYSIQLWELEEFLSYLIENKGDPHVNQILMYTGLLELSEEYTYFRLTSAKTRMILDRLGFEWSQMNQELMQKMLKHYRNKLPVN